MSEKDLGRQRDRDRGLSATPQHVCPRPSSGQRWQGAQEQVAVGAVAPGRPAPMTPPKSSKPFSPCPGQRAAPPYLGPSCSPAWKGQEAGGGGSGTISTHESPLLLCCSVALLLAGGGLWVFGFSLWDSLSLSPSLSCPAQLSGRHCCPLNPTPEPSPRRRSRRALQGLGAVTSAGEAGLLPGALAKHWLPSGEAGALGAFSAVLLTLVGLAPAHASRPQLPPIIGSNIT